MDPDRPRRRPLVATAADRDLASFPQRVNEAREAGLEDKKRGAEALYISRGHGNALDNSAAGIILPQHIDNFYHK